MKKLLSVLLCVGLILSLGSVVGSPMNIEASVVESDEINVVERGVDNTGATDVTDALTAIHKEGKLVYYPNGTYLFNGTTLDFSGGVRFESQDGVLIRNSISDTPIVNFDKKGNLIGLMHNHLEKRYGSKDYVVNGNLVSPPVSTAVNDFDIDVVPFWYNDFGRQSQLSSSGWKGWYDWRWNHHDCTTINGIEDAYDPNIHPLLGWYRGDEVEVLDWQCYWLREYGVDQTILLGGAWGDAWSDPSNGQYWMYNLLNNTPNAKKMKFALSDMYSWGFATTYDETEARWAQMVTEFYGNNAYKDQVYCYEVDGKRYPVLFVWAESYIEGQVGGKSNLQMLYQRLSIRMKLAGFDGVCIYARMGTMENRLAQMDALNIKWFNSAYPCNSIAEAGTYEEMVNSFDSELTSVNTVFGVSNGMHTHDPHPSQWDHPGNTPALFGKWLQKAVDAIRSDTNRPNMITVYNMSEWSEGSAGLVPTVGQGFGYLEAIYNAVQKNSSAVDSSVNLVDYGGTNRVITDKAQTAVWDGNTHTITFDHRDEVVGIDFKIPSIALSDEYTVSFNVDLHEGWEENGIELTLGSDAVLKVVKQLNSENGGLFVNGERLYSAEDEINGKDVRYWLAGVHAGEDGVQIVAHVNGNTVDFYYAGEKVASVSASALSNTISIRTVAGTWGDCVYLSNVAIHNGNANLPACSHTYDNACDATCNNCGATREVGDHVYDDKTDADCNNCGVTRNLVNIVTAPKHTYVTDGATATVKVEATGDGLTYQWYLRNDGQTKYYKSSITTDTYSVVMSDKAHNRRVYCVITDQYGNELQTATVILRRQATITAQPTNTYTANGAKAKTTVTALGDGLKYQWYVKNAGQTKYSKSSITTNTYSVTMSEKAKDRYVYCVVTDKYGKSVKSKTVVLRMTASIITQPSNVSVENGVKARTTVTAMGDGLTYQWYVKNVGADAYVKSSITTKTYSADMSSKVDGRLVYCVITDKYGYTVQTQVVTLEAK